MIRPMETKHILSFDRVGSKKGDFKAIHVWSQVFPVSVGQIIAFLPGI